MISFFLLQYYDIFFLLQYYDIFMLIGRYINFFFLLAGQIF